MDPATKRRVVDAWSLACAPSLEALQVRGEAASLKTLSMVVKNVHEKGAGDAGAKYRSLKLSNAKVAAAIGAKPAAMTLLAGLGFAKTADGALAIGADFDAPLIDFATQQLLAAAAAAPPAAPGGAGANAGAGMGAGAGAGVGEKREAAATAPSAGALEKMSMKQRARHETEQRARQARAAEEAQRKELLRKLAADKKARSADGWSASVVDKSDGKAMETFRGKFGEEPAG
jgi:hypothetical protein